MGIGRLKLAIALAASVVTFADPARSAEIVIRSAPRELDASRVENLVRLELGPDAAAVRVIVDDAPNDRVEVTIERDRGQASGVVDLHGSADAERTIALFVGELARRTPVPKPPSETPPPETPPPPNATPMPPEESSIGIYGLAAMGGRWMVSGDAFVATPHLEVGLAIRDRFRVGLLARYGYATADDRIGTISAHMASGGLAATVRFASRERFEAWTGPRVELGFLEGTGYGPGGLSASSVGVWGSWSVEGRARLGAFDALIAIDAGWLASGLELRSEDRKVLDVSGVFIGSSLGVAFR